MNRLVKNYLYNAAYQVFLVLVPLVTAPYLTRVLSQDSLGTYGYINSVVSIVSTVGLLGLNSYGYRQIAYDRDDVRKLAQSFSQIFCLRLLLLAALTCVYFPIVSRTENARYYYIQYMLIAAQFVDVSWVFIGVEDLGVVAFRNFIAKLLTVIGIFAFVRGDGDLWLYFFLFDAITLVTTLSLFRRLRRWTRFDRTGLRGMLGHLPSSIRLFIPQIATMLYLQFDKVMLKLLSGSAAAVAHYDYGEKIINIPLSIITALTTVMMPRLANLYANRQKEELGEYLNRTIRFSLFLAVPLMFGLAGISVGFVPWYLGENYEVTAYLLMILSPLCVLNTLSNVFGSQYLTAVNETRVLTVAYYGAAVIDIALNALLIPIWGAYGAAAATVVCSLFSVVYQFVHVRRRVDIRPGMISALPYLVWAAGMFVVVWGLGLVMRASVLTTAVQVAAGVGVFMAAAALSRDEMQRWILRQARALLKRK